LEKSLFEPLEDLFARPAKGVRGQMVELGYHLATSQPMSDEIKKISAAFSEILEALHAGSLIVDDIQDRSRVRRGQPSLHIRYGLPVALNAGNWLYFWPMLKVRELGLTPAMELEVYQLCHRTLARAHFGQAIDVGTTIDQVEQAEVEGVCLASLELKSGALMALAISLGAMLAGVSLEARLALENFGHDFGIALQIFDDIGNMKVSPELPFEATKRYEDLILKRPTFIWVVASQSFSEKEYRNFVNAVDHLPDESYLKPWLEIHSLLPLATRKAREHLKKTFSELQSSLSQYTLNLEAYDSVLAIGEKVATAYD